MKAIQKSLERKGYKLVNHIYINGEDSWHYIHKKDLDLVTVQQNDSPDTEILLDILGVAHADFDKKCKGREEEGVLRELVEKQEE